MTPQPDWMMQVDTSDLAQTQAKLAKNSEGHMKEKKQKPSRHIRARAKLPTDGPEREKYNLPQWVGDDSFKSMLMVILKTLANTQQRLRVMESVIADNFVVPTSIAPVACGVTQAEAYHKKAVSSPGEAMGPPGPQVLYAFCAQLVKCDIGDAPREDVKKNIIGKINNLPQDRASEVVAMFSVRPCYDPAYHKIVLVSQDPLVRDSFTRAIRAVRDVKHYTAPAPASGQEDEMQKWIEKLESLA